MGHFFVPNESNDFRARALHHDFLTFYLIIVISFVFSVKHLTGQFNNVLGFATDITNQKLYQLTNKERGKYGLSKLKYNETLSKAAYKKAQDMFAKNYWAHFAPDGKTPWNFMYDAGYKYEYAGENLAKNFLFSQNVVEAWMKSPSHKENVLRREYAEIGFAVVNGILNGEETTLVVQMFGKPLGTGLSFESESPGIQKAQVQAVSAPRISFNFFFLFIGFLSFVLILDLYFGAKMNVIRFHGKTFIHIIFLFSVSLGLILFITKGLIL